MRLHYDVFFHPLAKREFDDSFLWYEEALIGLGEEFMWEVESMVELIRREPRLFQIKKKNLREAPLKNFPYLIIYRIKGHNITITSVFHTSRNPKKKRK